MLKERLGIETRLIKGDRGVFEVRVGDRVVAKKTLDGFPNEEAIVSAVRQALG